MVISIILKLQIYKGCRMTIISPAINSTNSTYAAGFKDNPLSYSSKSTPSNCRNIHVAPPSGNRAPLKKPLPGTENLYAKYAPVIGELKGNFNPLSLDKEFDLFCRGTVLNGYYNEKIDMCVSILKAEGFEVNEALLKKELVSLAKDENNISEGTLKSKINSFIHSNYVDAVLPITSRDLSDFFKCCNRLSGKLIGLCNELNNGKLKFHPCELISYFKWIYDGRKNPVSEAIEKLSHGDAGSSEEQFVKDLEKCKSELDKVMDDYKNKEKIGSLLNSLHSVGLLIDYDELCEYIAYKVEGSDYKHPVDVKFEEWKSSQSDEKLTRKLNWRLLKFYQEWERDIMNKINVISRLR